MRLPVTVPISTKDGTSNKNARLTNCLKETTKKGDKAVVRPGLVTQVEGTGVGGGLVAFNNELVSVYGTTLGFGPNGDELSDWTKINTQLMTGRGCVTNNGSVCLQFSQSSIDGNSWTTGLSVNNEDAATIAIGSDFYSAFSGNLIKSINSGVSWTTVSTLPSSGGNDVIYYAGGVLYYSDTAIQQSWSSPDLGATWVEIFPSSYPSSSQANQIMVGSTLYLFDGVSGNYEYSTDYHNFTGGSLYSSGVSIGYYENGNFYGHNFSTGHVFKSPVSALNTATILGVVPPASDPGSYFFHQGQPFKIGTQSFIFGLGGVYRSSGSITPLATIQPGLYDFAQGPI